MAADALISFVVNKLGDFVVGGGQQAREIRDDIEWLKGELPIMKAFLKDADRQSATNEAMKEWVKQVKSVAFRIEDFLDEYAYEENARMEKNTGIADLMKLNDGVANFMIKVGMANLKMPNISFYQQMASQIHGIKNSVEHISKRGQTFCLHHKTEGERVSLIQQRCIQHSPMFEGENELVGFEEDVRKLTDWLLCEQANTKCKHSIMSLVGMAGSGKSSIARKAYNLVHNSFDHHHWVNVSKFSSIDETIEDIARGFRVKYRPRYLLDLPRRMHRLLEKKRYILVLDDVSDISIWSAIKNTLPCNGIGRIIFTNREEITASLCDEDCQVHTPNPLPFDLARNLFCSKAFRNYEPPGVCPPYLYEWAIAIVSKCCGLPLAIVLMAGLMSKRASSPKEWKNVIEHYNQELLCNPSLKNLTQNFEASYNHLPSYLKYCFLYLCLFPSGHEIKTKMIIRMWVAQGFVENQEGRTLESTANGYIIQLVERCMIQPVAFSFTGELVSFKVHGIMRDYFEASKFKEEFGICDAFRVNQMHEKRYLAFHQEYEDLFNISKTNLMSAHSLLYFSTKQCSSLQMKLAGFKFLRVLLLDGIHMRHLPEEVSHICSLRYLSLRNTKICDLPSTLVRLVNLETLDVRNTCIKSIPFGISLKKLRHLLLRTIDIYGIYRPFETHFGFKNFNLLQTLSGVEANGTFISILGHLGQLTKLSIYVHARSNRRELFSSIAQLQKLHSLKIRCADRMDKYQEFMFDATLPLPAYIEKLSLEGTMMELPLWFGSLKSLCILKLVNSMLVINPLSKLAALPNLVSLHLIHAFTGEKMGCGPGGFPRLRHLLLASLIEFTEWTILQNNTMPCIEQLSIVDCGKLRMLPEGFENLKTLQSLEVIEMPEDFIGRLRTEDSFKVQHIPKLTLLSIAEASRTGSPAKVQFEASGYDDPAERKGKRKIEDLSPGNSSMDQTSSN